MKLRNSYIINLTVAVCLSSFFNAPSVFSRPTIKDEGQAKLMQEINAGQKYNQLTVKEANKLRKDLANVARKKAKMLGKTNRKLSDENRTELISDLNEISNNIHKLELKKRVLSKDK